ncbi:GNAT family N-acetyltransferase [Vagococcus fluvialis]
MGRIVGDGGTVFQVVDIVVDPAYQGKGLGKLIVKELVQYIHKKVDEQAYVNLIADEKLINYTPNLALQILVLKAVVCI